MHSRSPTYFLAQLNSNLWRLLRARSQEAASVPKASWQLRPMTETEDGFAGLALTRTVAQVTPSAYSRRTTGAILVSGAQSLMHLRLLCVCFGWRPRPATPHQTSRASIMGHEETSSQVQKTAKSI